MKQVSLIILTYLNLHLYLYSSPPWRGTKGVGCIHPLPGGDVQHVQLYNR